MNRTKLALDLTSLAVAVAGGIMAVSNQIVAIPGMPKEITYWWPAVLGGATLVDRIGNVVLNYLQSKPDQPKQ